MIPIPASPAGNVPGIFSFDPGPLAHAAGRIVETVGIAIIVLGAAASTALFLYRFYQRRRFDEVFHELRSNLGRAVLLGLEFLVAADIIGTVSVEPTFHNLGVLGLIVVIRTFLSFTLEVEINGRWPWKERETPPAPGGEHL